MLHLETIEPLTLALLKRLQALPVLAETRLVGGTALALQLGHRTSIDLDIFGKWDYSEDLAAALSRVGKVEKESESSSGKMAFFFIDDVKVDCVSYEEYKWLDPPVDETGVRLAGRYLGCDGRVRSSKWQGLPSGGNPAFRFFTVEVALP